LVGLVVRAVSGLRAPVYEAASTEHPDIVFGKVDTGVEPELSAAFQIRAIPTLMVFRDGILLYREAGALPGRALEQLIQRVRDLDMVDVRRRIGTAQTKEAKRASVA
jgi:thioredoxin 1